MKFSVLTALHTYVCTIICFRYHGYIMYLIQETDAKNQKLSDICYIIMIIVNKYIIIINVYYRTIAWTMDVHMRCYSNAIWEGILV